MFTIFANYYIAELERQGADEAAEGRLTVGGSRSKTTPRRSGKDHSKLGTLYRRLLLTRVGKWLQSFQRKRPVTLAGTPGNGKTIGHVHPIYDSEGPQRIENVLDWSFVVRRHRSGVVDGVVIEPAREVSLRRENIKNNGNSEHDDEEFGNFSHISEAIVKVGATFS